MREEQSGVYGVNIEGGPVKYPKPKYTVTAFWGCSPDSISMLSQTLLTEITKIRNAGPVQEDLNKVKETLIRERETNLKENNFWISALQNHYFIGSKLRTIEEYKTFVNSLTGKDVQAVAERYLNTQSYVRVALTPGEKASEK